MSNLYPTSPGRKGPRFAMRANAQIKGPFAKKFRYIARIKRLTYAKLVREALEQYLANQPDPPQWEKI